MEQRVQRSEQDRSNRLEQGTNSLIATERQSKPLRKISSSSTTDAWNRKEKNELDAWRSGQRYFVR